MHSCEILRFTSVFVAVVIIVVTLMHNLRSCFYCCRISLQCVIIRISLQCVIIRISFQCVVVVVVVCALWCNS